MLLPSTSHKDDLLEADMSLRKRAYFTAPTSRFEVGESSSAAAARQAERPMSREVGFGITNTWDELVDTIQKITPTTLEEVNQSMTELASTTSRDTHEIHVRLEDAQDDITLHRGRVNMLFRDRRFHCHTAMLLESKARHAWEVWSHSMNCSKVVHDELQAYRVQVNTHEIQIQTRDTHIGSLETLVTTLVA
ncbi:hypothetical protein Tco_1017568 [Tanacetum coccineum]|uniref:Uncharacterized protein n=1 Tax=Tanacetum coccineum TaxID=301880 RepID=A0ABQ5FRU1_9ASTR